MKPKTKTFANLIIALALLAAGPARAGTGELRLTVEEAVKRALTHNLGLQQQKLAPALSEAAEQVARATFEPALFTEADLGRSPGQVSSQRAGLDPTSTTSVGGEVGVRKSFSTGTSVELGLSSQALLGGGGLDPAYQSGVTLSVRQALLNGVSRSANEVAITTARLARKEAQQKLNQQAEEVLARTLEAYFDLHRALAQDAIQALAIRTSETTLKDTLTLIAAGKVAGSEEISVRYTLQTQRRAKLQTEQAVAEARDRLARLIGLVAPSSLATPTIVTVETTPSLPGAAELERLRAAALKGRGDYLAAQSAIEAQQARVNASKHKLLPKLDLVGSLFASGLSGTSSSDSAVDPGYWSSYKMDRLGWSVGLVFELPLGNDRAKGELKSAELELRRARLAAEQVQQTIAEELNRAWRAVQLARDQLALTEAAEQVVQSKLRSEEERYKAGKTTAHILAAVQAEAIQERLGRAQASADLHKALVNLHATAGDLLDRLHLAV